MALYPPAGSCTVSIHAPVWVRPSLVPFASWDNLVSIHAPVWVRPLLTVPGVQMTLSFNSRTRVGATQVFGSGYKIYKVSIHAPVWVRPFPPDDIFRGTGFQFTHPCGCDTDDAPQSDGLGSFNSRTRVGATCSHSAYGGFQPVSIHAPVWVRRPDEYGLSIKHATKVLRQPDARTRCGQA